MKSKQPLTQTALSVVHVFKSDKDFQDNLNTIKDNELCLIPNIEMYPVGSIYMSTINIDPAQLFGGKWQALNEGRVLIGANGSYPAGSKGGEVSHRLSTSEMPSHTHSGSSSNSAGSHKHSDAWGEHTTVGSPAYGFYNTSNNKFGTGGGGMVSYMMHSSSGGSHSHSVSISSAGSGSAHNNMMPYQSVYMWYRVS